MEVISPVRDLAGTLVGEYVVTVQIKEPEWRRGRGPDRFGAAVFGEEPSLLRREPTALPIS
jgi:hypothetical protein